ncbi:MAG: FHA domain-containing protein [Chloroflexi bacterium]|nr:FHA domain-containing protein [Chloroflexota bacterium]
MKTKQIWPWRITAWPSTARITCQNETYWLYDEGSAHGTYLNYTASV